MLGQRFYAIALCLLLLGATFNADSLNACENRAGQTDAVEQTPEPRAAEKRPWLDFSFDYDPQDLYQRWVDHNQWRRIWGPIGLGDFHIFPSRQTGPNHGPPLRIWGTGFGTSLWRDPITGHPLM